MKEAGERVKKIRDSKNETQTEFAKKIGLKQPALAGIEKGKIKLTKRNANAICKAYNVNPNWLETGDGEMFLPPKGSSYLDKLCDDFELGTLEKQVLERYLNFPPEQRQIIASWILDSFDFVENLLDAEGKKESGGRDPRLMEESLGGTG